MFEKSGGDGAGTGMGADDAADGGKTQFFKAIFPQKIAIVNIFFQQHIVDKMKDLC